MTTAGLDMELAWDFTAESYLDQLPPVERSRVLHAVEQLSTDWDSLEGSRLMKLAGDQDHLFTLRVGSDLRVVVRPARRHHHRGGCRAQKPDRRIAQGVGTAGSSWLRSFAPLSLRTDILGSDLAELEDLLSSASSLRERDQVIPFFRARPHLSAALGFANNAVELPDRWATELDLFGDFVCDVAAGDSEANAYTLIEFEDAQEHSIFSRLQVGKTMKRWSPRFEHGFSQLVDWAWRISAEGESSAAFRRIFGDDNPAIHLLLVIGRDADLTRDDLTRLRWRAKHTALGQFRMSCFTFDGLLQSIRRRLLLAAQSPGTA